MDNIERMKSCLNIVRRVSPKYPDKNLNSLKSLAPDLEEELLQRIDTPLEIETDKELNDFIKCEYNRDEDSYRSPYTNTYIPNLPESDFFPSKKLRSFEVRMNSLLRTYKEYYYGPEGVSSAYAWDLEGDSFAVALVVKNVISNKKALTETLDESDFATSGVWNSINVVSVSKETETSFKYRCFCTVYLTMDTDLNITAEENKKESVEVNGYNTMEVTKIFKVGKSGVEDDHLVNVGKTMEEAETQIRNMSLDVFIHRMQHTTMGILQSKVDRKRMELLATLNKDCENEGKKRMGSKKGSK